MRKGAADHQLSIPGKREQFWNSPLVITSYGRIHETAFRPWQSDNIPRRYCSGDVMLSDGKLRTVHYSIIEDGGFAGFNQGVEWCVPALTAIGPTIRAAGPRGPDLGGLAAAPSIFVLEMFHLPARLDSVE